MQQTERVETRQLKPLVTKGWTSNGTGRVEGMINEEIAQYFSVCRLYCSSAGLPWGGDLSR